MKKALFVATIDSHIKAFHLPYLRLLKNMGYEVHVATNGDEMFPNCDVKHNICIERSPFSLKNLNAIKQLKKIINNEKFDIVHCHTPMGGVTARLAAKHARKKYDTRVIYTAHGFHFYKGAPKLNWILFYPIEKWLSKYTDTLITINKEDYELANNKFNKRCKNIIYVPGVGIDTKKFSQGITEKEKKSLKKSFGLEQEDLILTCVARLDKNKNQEFLINAMEKLVELCVLANNLKLFEFFFNFCIELMKDEKKKRYAYYAITLYAKSYDRAIHDKLINFVLEKYTSLFVDNKETFFSEEALLCIESLSYIYLKDKPTLTVFTESPGTMMVILSGLKPNSFLNKLLLMVFLLQATTSFLGDSFATPIFKLCLI